MCDIHFYVEKIVHVPRQAKATWESPPSMYNTVYTRPKWISADKWSECPDTGKLYVDWKDSFFSNNCYMLFSVLADVRNDWGITPFEKPRGLPRQMSKLTRNASKRLPLDFHSYSYFTLAELMNIDLDKAEKEYIEFEDKNKTPQDKRYYAGQFQNIKDKLNNTIKLMKKLDDNPENVRCVFWFDN